MTYTHDNHEWGFNWIDPATKKPYPLEVSRPFSMDGRLVLKVSSGPHVLEIHCSAMGRSCGCGVTMWGWRRTYE